MRNKANIGKQKQKRIKKIEKMISKIGKNDNKPGKMISKDKIRSNDSSILLLCR